MSFLPSVRVALGALLISACTHGAIVPAPAIDARGRFLRDTLVMAAPTHGLYAGTTVTLAAQVWRAGAAVPDSLATVHWTVRDVRQAWVTASGTLVALEHGKVTLVAESGVLQSVQELEIRENPIDRLDIGSQRATLAIGDTARIITRLTSRDGTPVPDARVHYAVSSRGLGSDAGATIDEHGRFVARTPGSYTVLAAVGTVASQTTIVVPAPMNRAWPEPMEDLEIVEPTYQPYVGTFGVMRAEGRPALRNETRLVPAVRWTSSDSTVARIAPDGTIAFVNEGRVTIAAEAGGKRAERKLTVRRDAAAHLSLRIGEHDIRVGDAVPLVEQIWQRGGTPIRDARVNYGVVTHGARPVRGAVEITEDGRFIARTPGVYTIIAEIGGVADQATVVVRRSSSVANAQRVDR